MAKALGAKTIIGIDPSSSFNAWAVYDRIEGQWQTGQFRGIGRLYGCDLEQHIHIHGALAIVECPSWGGFGTKVVRSAAVQWERFLKEMGLGIKVLRVDPRDWQALVLGSSKTKTTKEMALLRASEILKVPVETDHIADAVCMAYYGGLIATGAIEEPPKTKKPKCKKAS